MAAVEPEWLLKSVVESFHAQQLREHGGGQGLRDAGMLDSALQKPQQMWHYENPRPDIASLAAAYAYGLSRNHPYVDGNKRTAAIACEVFLLLNDYEFTIGETEKYPNYLALASGEHTQESFAQWLRDHTRTSTKT